MTIPPRSRTARAGAAVSPPLRATVAAAIAALMVAGLVCAQVAGLYYREVARDGRIYVFNTSERFKAFQSSGEMGTAITLIGRGANGETVVAENETALDLFLFKHDLPAYDRQSPKPPSPAAFPQVKVGATGFLSYQDGRSAGAPYSKFVVKRAYLNLSAAINPDLSVRVTPDVTQDATTGETRYRLKYAYGTFTVPSIGFLAKPFVSLGMVQTPWLDFEEKIDRYRMQDALFMDRVGLISSADVGLVAGALFGGEMPEEYQRTVSSAFPGRFGSFAVGVYNGGGYAASEQNTDKPVEGRLTVRPLPDLVPGLQISYSGVSGRGNTPAAPRWTLSSAAVTFESRRVNVVGAYLTGTGDLAGKAVDAHGVPLDRTGWSAFAEFKATAEWSVIGRYDVFRADTSSPIKDTARTIAGVAYHLGRGNDLLLDYDRLRYEDPSRHADTRTQLTLQFNF
ncbi:MAG TPA: hypothetical protein VMT19_10425 [Thermoanaerobaculaceae bacterium]|nr:hypothetical protein [Thermoanaerobaculaceae bacterium]